VARVHLSRGLLREVDVGDVPTERAIATADDRIETEVPLGAATAVDDCRFPEWASALRVADRAALASTQIGGFVAALTRPPVSIACGDALATLAGLTDRAERAVRPLPRASTVARGIRSRTWVRSF
jgi:hypothetical protein